MNYFISGHRNITYKEFVENYVDQIKEKELNQTSRFILSDCEGVDRLAQEFLNSLGISKFRVKIFHLGDRPDFNKYNFSTHGGFINREALDNAMTSSTDADIAWVRIGKGDSYTAKNLKRRNPVKYSDIFKIRNYCCSYCHRSFEEHSYKNSKKVKCPRCLKVTKNKPVEKAELV